MKPNQWRGVITAVVAAVAVAATADAIAGSLTIIASHRGGNRSGCPSFLCAKPVGLAPMYRE